MATSDYNVDFSAFPSNYFAPGQEVGPTGQRGTTLTPLGLQQAYSLYGTLTPQQKAGLQSQLAGLTTSSGGFSRSLAPGSPEAAQADFLTGALQGPSGRSSNIMDFLGPLAAVGTYGLGSALFPVAGTFGDAGIGGGLSTLDAAGGEDAATLAGSSGAGAGDTLGTSAAGTTGAGGIETINPANITADLGNQMPWLSGGGTGPFASGASAASGASSIPSIIQALSGGMQIANAFQKPTSTTQQQIQDQQQNYNNQQNQFSQNLINAMQKASLPRQQIPNPNNPLSGGEAPEARYFNNVNPAISWPNPIPTTTFAVGGSVRVPMPGGGVRRPMMPVNPARPPMRPSGFAPVSYAVRHSNQMATGGSVEPALRKGYTPLSVLSPIIGGGAGRNIDTSMITPSLGGIGPRSANVTPIGRALPAPYAGLANVTPGLELMAKGGNVSGGLDSLNDGPNLNGGSIGNFVTGGGGGQADNVDAKLSSGEYVVPADVVSHLGDGDNQHGALQLDNAVSKIRKHKTGANKFPPKAKPVSAYLGGGM